MVNKKKYIISLVVMVFFAAFGITFVNATSEMNVEESIKIENFEGFFDTGFSNEVYKFSENNKEIKLPFFRFSNERMIIDKELNKSGFCFSAKAIEMDSKVTGIQTLFSADTIRVNANMEYGILFADGDIIIDSNIDKSLVLISSGTVTITENATINEDIVLVSNNLELEGNVLGSVIGSVTNSNITGKINGDLRLAANDVKFSTNDNVKNNIYITTYNEELNIADKYPEAIIKLQEVEKTNEFSFDKIFSTLFNCLLFALMYIIINKVAKKDIFNVAMNKISKNSVTVLISGTVLLLAIFPLMFILIMLSALELWVVALPILLIYTVALIVILMLGIFVVGSLMYNYIKQKYLKDSGIGTDILGAFCSYLVLSILTKLPFVGLYIGIIINILAVGIVFTLIFKRQKEE